MQCVLLDVALYTERWWCLQQAQRLLSRIGFVSSTLFSLCYPCADQTALYRARCGFCRTRKGHLTKADLAEGLRIASPNAFQALSNAGSLESELAEEFAAMDANGDGKISFEEFKTALSGAKGLDVSPQTVPVTAH